MEPIDIIDLLSDTSSDEEEVSEGEPGVLDWKGDDGIEDCIIVEDVPDSGAESRMVRLLQCEHALCDHRDACRRWMVAYLDSERDLSAPGSSWVRARQQTWRCMDCYDAYLEFKEDLFRNPTYRLKHAERVDAFDKQRLESTLQSCLHRVRSANGLSDEDKKDLCYAVYELLKDVALLLRHKGLYDLLIEWIRSFGHALSFADKTMARQFLPGVLLLLADHCDQVRAWALKHKAMLRIRAEDFGQVEPVFRRWYKVLESVYLEKERPVSVERGWQKLTVEQCWLGVQSTLAHLEDTDRSAPMVVDQFPILTDIIFSHVADVIYGRPIVELHHGMPPIIYECVGLALDKLEHHCWSSPNSMDSYQPSNIMRGIAQLVGQGRHLDDQGLQPLVAALPPLIRSVPRLYDSQRSLSASMTGEALEICISVYHATHQMERHQMVKRACADIIKFVYQNWTRADATLWPTAGSAKWSAMLLRELVGKVGSGDEASVKKVNEACCQALSCCLEAHSTYVKELMADTFIPGARVQPALQRDLLCQELFKLVAIQPFTKLAPALRDAVFMAQAQLWLVPTKESLFAPPFVKSVIRAAHDRMVAFTGFLKSQLDVNPLNQAAATLGPTILPILMSDDSELRRVMQLFMAERTEKSRDGATLKEAFALLLNRAGASVFRGAEHIINDMARLADERYHPFFSYWSRLFTLLGSMVDAADPSSPEHQEGVRRLWSQLSHMLQAALSRDGRHRHRASDAYLKTYAEVFKVVGKLLPVACFHELRGGTWLGLLLDWVEDGSVPHPELRKQALDVVLALIRAINSIKSALDGLIWQRLLDLVRDKRLPQELRNAIENFTNSTVVSVSDISVVPQAERRGIGASAIVRRGLQSTLSERGDMAKEAGRQIGSMAGSGSRKENRGPVSRPPIVVQPVRAQDEVEMFSHLRDLQKAVMEHAREMHMQVLRWCLRDVLQSEERRNKAEAVQKSVYVNVPVRFVDELHYMEVFGPLLLEETRCALGKELLERRPAMPGSQQQRGRAGMDRFIMKPHSKVPEKEGEGGGLFTLSFSLDFIRFNDLRRQGLLSGDDVFVIRPRGKKDDKAPEEGEVSDEDLQGVSESYGVRDDGDALAVVDWQVEAAQPHLLAVVLEEVRPQVGQRSSGHDGEAMQLIRFRVWLPASEAGGYAALDDEATSPALRVVMDHRSFRSDTEWVAGYVGSLTTSLREFAALRTVQSIRLAGRLIQGGRNKASSSNLQAVTKEGLLRAWGSLSDLCKRCLNAPPHDPMLINAVRGIKKLKKVRVTAILLKDSGVLALLKELRKTHRAESIREACQEVFEGWKQQVAAEKECYAPLASEKLALPQSTDGSPAPMITSSPSAARLPSASNEPVKCPVQVPSQLWEKLAAEFNPPQLRAIAAACNTNTKSFRKSGEITLLQGPPGTGKTRTILGLLSAILHLSVEKGGLISTAHRGSGGGNIRPAVRYSGNPRNTRVLVCAPSNGAVDVIVQRLKTDGLVDANGKAFHPPIVRLGNTDPSSSPIVQLATLDSQVEAKVQKSMELQAFKLAEEELLKLRAQILALDRGGALPGDTGKAKDDLTPVKRTLIRKQMKAQIGDASRRRVDALRALDSLKSRIRVEIIRDARIVLSTLSTSAANALNDAVAAIGQGYGTVVVDEAGQAVEPSTIIPLRYGCRNLILVGDPRQLPATVMSELVKSHNYDLSLFERLEKGGHPVHMLTVQYRMHPEIRQFPSMRFYGGKLRDAPHLCGEATSGRTDDTPVTMPYHAEPCFSPYLVYHVSNGREQRVKLSYSNTGEARFAVDIFRCLLVDYPKLTVYDRIAVITPYKSQVSTLRHYFNKYAPEGWEKLVELSTVDGFQGREKDLIIFSCVRTGQGVGFMADERRMNVALTRAKRALFVLCNAQTLSHNASWAALVEDARQRHCLVNTRDFDFKGVREMLKDKPPVDRAGYIRIAYRPPAPSSGPAEGPMVSNMSRSMKPYGGGRPEGGRGHHPQTREGPSAPSTAAMPGFRGDFPASPSSSWVHSEGRGEKRVTDPRGGLTEQATQRRRLQEAGDGGREGSAGLQDSVTHATRAPPAKHPPPSLSSAGRAASPVDNRKPSSSRPRIPTLQPTPKPSLPLPSPSTAPPPRPSVRVPPRPFASIPPRPAMPSSSLLTPQARPGLSNNIPPRPPHPPKDRSRKGGASSSSTSRSQTTATGGSNSTSSTRRAHSPPSPPRPRTAHKRPRSGIPTNPPMPVLPSAQRSYPARPVELAGGLPPRPTFAPRPSMPPQPPARPLNPNIISASRPAARTSATNNSIHRR